MKKNGIATEKETKRRTVAVPKDTPPAADNGITELVFILDRSGSMGGLEGDVIGGFNAMIEKQRKLDGACLVNTALFDNVSEVLYDRVQLAEVPAMTADDYCVRGCTALIDAIGGAIHHVETVHSYLRPEDVPAHTLFIITTDGYENASHRFSSDEVKRMIERKKEACGWEFLFIGANIDAVETANHFGIAPDRAVNYVADETGTAKVFGAVSKAAACVRGNAKLDAAWCEEIDKDYKSRKKGRQ